MIALPGLARLTAPPPHPAPIARCELCTTAIGDHHRHVVELGTRGVSCACTACSILFGRDSAGRYRTVPDRVRFDRSFALPPERLGIPVGVSFCYRDSLNARTIACYPGPAGIVDAELPDDAWACLAAATSLASILEPDVEALLLRSRRGSAQVACYLVPITSAFELAARLRESWSGFTGGDGAERALAQFFEELDARGVPA